MQRILFELFSLDVVNKRLWQGDQVVRLSLKAFDVLTLLLMRPGELVRKEDLLAAVWPKSVAGDAVLKMSIREIRKALADDSRNPRLIETVHRRGYTFIGKATYEEGSVSAEYVQPATPARTSRQPSPLLAEASASLPVPLVGQERELEIIEGLWNKVLQGRRQVLFLTGEMGAGKTTLVNRLLNAVSTGETVHLLRGHCLAHQRGKDIYLPLLEALGCLTRVPGFERNLSSIMRRYAPTWLLQMPALIDVGERDKLRVDDPGILRERMLRELADVIHALAVDHPLVLILENLHWSDDFTLEFVGLLAHRVEPARLLLVGTYRPEEVVGSDHLLCAFKNELDAHQQCTELSIPLLSLDMTEKYLKLRCEGQPMAPKVLQSLHYWANGNPYFLSCLVDKWREDGVTAPVDHDPGLIPPMVRQSITARIERLANDDIVLLEAASLVGMEFSAQQVADAIDADVVAIEERCEQLARRCQFIRPLHRRRRRDPSRQWPDRRAATRYTFIHPLFQRILQERIAIARQNRLRSRIVTTPAVERIGDRRGLGSSESSMTQNP